MGAGGRKGKLTLERQSSPWRKAFGRHKLKEDLALESRGPGRDLMR